MEIKVHICVFGLIKREVIKHILLNWWSKGVGWHEVQLERVNPSLIPTDIAQESKWPKSEATLNVEYSCSGETHLRFIHFVIFHCFCLLVTNPPMDILHKVLCYIWRFLWCFQKNGKGDHNLGTYYVAGYVSNYKNYTQKNKKICMCLT